MTDRMIDFRTANPADRIALRGVRVNATLVGMTARTAIEQVFVNQEARAVEAVYTFPLPDEGAVCSFEIVVADRVLTGVVDEREQAIAKYEDAINQGEGAFLLEQERPDIFTVRVGNLLPRQAVTVRLTYVQPLDVTDSTVRFALPTTVAPRYVTATATDPLQAAIDGDAINPPHVLQVPYGLMLGVHVDLGRQLRSISSASHAIKTEFGENHQYRISFAGGVSEMNRDVVIELKLAHEVSPSVQIGDGPDGAKYLAVSFLPEFEERDLANQPPADVMFVIDCSGSMGGESIQQAKAALELCLRSLNLGDTFNVCCFGSQFNLMWPQPRVYGDATLKQALHYVARIDANLGGTELYSPLVAVLANRTETVRQVILLTDGQISNEDAVMKLVRQHKAHNRVFAFGIGSSPSASLVNGLARASAGAAEFISPGENIADKVLRTFSRLASPSLVNVEVDFALAEATVATPHLPPVFDGDMLTLYARVTGKLPETITLRARAATGEKAWTAAVASSRGDEPAIATTWARKMIQTLEADADLNRQRLLEISRKFNLVCSLTAFVAIEHRSIEDRNDGKPALRRVPVQLAEGWGGIDAMAMGGALPSSLADMCLDRSIDGPLSVPSPAPARKRSVMDWIRKSKAAQKPGVQGSLSRGMVRGSYDRHSDTAPKREQKVMTPLQQLLALQSAEGWFDQSSFDLDLMNPSPAMKELGAKAAKADQEHVMWTLLAMLDLKQDFVADEPIWRAAFEKALRYLAKATGQTIDDIAAILDASAATK